MGLHTVEVSSIIRPGSLIPLPPPPTTGTATAADVEKGATSADQWGKNMQRWRNDNIDIGKGERTGGKRSVKNCEADYSEGVFRSHHTVREPLLRC
ncbi:Uncharacterized protein APZ42_014645 [Daphnia magna]|uniref:Uncharacterized protein n=1 Tax=Daphnia magna TaxID=35525 RepID=A0A162PS78_9CRUS|nr:Uncharacterized protein APZ42_014645 [Daphnia magna]